MLKTLGIFWMLIRIKCSWITSRATRLAQFLATNIRKEPSIASIYSALYGLILIIPALVCELIPLNFFYFLGIFLACSSLLLFFFAMINFGVLLIVWGGIGIGKKFIKDWNNAKKKYEAQA